MKTKFAVLLAALLAIFLTLATATTARAQPQFVLDCACLAKLPGMTVTNCQATVPDLCAVVTNCFRSSAVPPPAIPLFQCSQTPPAGGVVGPGTYLISVTVQFVGTAPVLCAVPFRVVAPITGPFTLQCQPDSKTCSAY